MRSTKLSALVVVGGLSLAVLVPPGASQEKRQATGKVTTVAVPVYKPPLRGAPGGRVGGGTRGLGRDAFVLSALVPDHGGYAAQEQPSLYWFISAPTSLPVEVTVTDPRVVKPVLETRLPSPIAAGVHRIRLADYGVRLEPGVAYRWFVAVVPDPARRSWDNLAGGIVERVEVTDALRMKLAGARPDELAFIHAEAGLWYDALEAISELIERDPGNRDLQRQRAAFIAQVGLSAVSDR